MPYVFLGMEVPLGFQQPLLYFFGVFFILFYFIFFMKRFMCGLWIFFDYGMTFASVFTLLAISVDRLWAVRWSLHYRSNKTKTKTFVGIAIVWSVGLGEKLIYSETCE
jgi:hypothetical protein